MNTSNRLGSSVILFLAIGSACAQTASLSRQTVRRGAFEQIRVDTGATELGTEVRASFDGAVEIVAGSFLRTGPGQFVCVVLGRQVGSGSLELTDGNTTVRSRERVVCFEDKQDLMSFLADELAALIRRFASTPAGNQFERAARLFENWRRIHGGIAVVDDPLFAQARAALVRGQALLAEPGAAGLALALFDLLRNFPLVPPPPSECRLTLPRQPGPAPAIGVISAKASNEQQALFREDLEELGASGDPGSMTRLLDVFPGTLFGFALAPAVYGQVHATAYEPRVDTHLPRIPAFSVATGMTTVDASGGALAVSFPPGRPNLAASLRIAGIASPLDPVHVRFGALLAASVHGRGSLLTRRWSAFEKAMDATGTIVRAHSLAVQRGTLNGSQGETFVDALARIAGLRGNIVERIVQLRPGALSEPLRLVVLPQLRTYRAPFAETLVNGRALGRLDLDGIGRGVGQAEVETGSVFVFAPWAICWHRGGADTPPLAGFAAQAGFDSDLALDLSVRISEWLQDRGIDIFLQAVGYTRNYEAVVKEVTKERKAFNDARTRLPAVHRAIARLEGDRERLEARLRQARRALEKAVDPAQIDALRKEVQRLQLALREARRRLAGLKQEKEQLEETMRLSRRFISRVPKVPSDPAARNRQRLRFQAEPSVEPKGYGEAEYQNLVNDVLADIRRLQSRQAQRVRSRK